MSGRRRVGPPGVIAALAASVALMAVAAGPGDAARAAAAARARAFATLYAPVHPGSAFAERLGHHRAEAQTRAVDGLPDAAALLGAGVAAKGFGALLETTWRFAHQEATVEVDAKVPEIAVEVTVTVEAVADGIDSIGLRLPKVVIDAVTLPAAASATWSYSEPFGQIGLVDVKLANKLAKGETFTVALRYHATLDCNAKTTLLRTCTFNDEFSQVLFFRVFADHAAALHAPHTSTLHIRTPAGKVAAAPGVPSGPQQLDDGRLLWSFEQPERTENGGFSIADYQVTGTGAGGGTSAPWLRLLTLPAFKANAADLHASAKAMVDFFAARFGAYPWQGLSLIQVANNFGGGYAPLSGIFMLRNVFGAKEGGQGWTSWSELTAHEIAHQWWGNLARPMSTADVSLSEAMAEFSSCLYTETALQTRAQLVEDNLSYVYTVDAQDDRPLGSATVYSSPAYVPIVYHKGAVVLDMLRLEIGEAAMLQGMDAYASAFDRDYAKVDDLRAAMEQAAGVDLGWFFAQWWAGKGRLDIEFEAEVEATIDATIDAKNDAKGNAYVLRLRLAQLGDKPMRFKLPLHVTVAGGEVVKTTVDVLPPASGWISVVEVPFAKRPLVVRPDVQRHLLRRFRVLNGADVTLDGTVDGLDLVESAFRQRRTIVWQKSFYPNTLWDELFDGDASYTVDAGDLDLIYEHAGSGAPAP